MDKSKTIPVVLGILVIGVAAFFALSQPSSSQVVKKTAIPVSNPTVSNPNASNPNPAAGGQINTGGYTLAEVAAHGDATSCWSAINGNVYDLTKWIAQHPGGEGAILSICGKDGSTAFNNQHGGQSRPESILSNYIIGALK